MDAIAPRIYLQGVNRNQFPVVLVLILVLSFAIFHVAGLVIAVIGLLVSYILSLRLHPRIRHTGFRGCGGSGEHRGSVFTWVHRKCPGCQGGRMVRWGAGHFGADHIKSEYDRSKRAQAAAREQHKWR